MTVTVLFFQVAIFVSIVVAATRGRTIFAACLLVWTVWTLSGAVFTWGLALLQFVTIIFGFEFAVWFLPKTGSVGANPRLPPAMPVPAATPQSSNNALPIELVIVIVVLAWVFWPGSREPSVGSHPIAPMLTAPSAPANVVVSAEAPIVRKPQGPKHNRIPLKRIARDKSDLHSTPANCLSVSTLEEFRNCSQPAQSLRP